MKKIDFNFNLCIDSEILIDFIEQNSDFEWNEICDMEYKHSHSDYIDNSRAYPIILLDEKDESTFQYWTERFLDAYSDEIGDKTVYIIN